MSVGFQTTVINVDEARLAAVQSLLQSKISDLDTLLQLAPLSMPASTAVSGCVLIGDPDALNKALPFSICVMGGGKADGTDWQSEYKYIGVPNSTSAFKNDIYTQLRVYIHPDTLPVASQTQALVTTQTEYRERLLSRICDWIRADSFQVLAGVDLALTSREQGPITSVSAGATSATQGLASVSGITDTDTLYFHTAGVSRAISSISGLNVTLASSLTTVTNEVVTRQDKLTQGKVARIMKGRYEKGYGAGRIEVMGAEVHLEHILN